MEHLPLIALGLDTNLPLPPPVAPQLATSHAALFSIISMSRPKAGGEAIIMLMLWGLSPFITSNGG